MRDEWVDLPTGEVVADSAIIDKARRLQYGLAARSPFGRRWFKMSMVAITKLGTLGIGGMEMRVLLVVLGTIRDGNLIDVSQSSLARELDTYQPTVSRALGIWSL